jgi:hypothetical protein
VFTKEKRTKKEKVIIVVVLLIIDENKTKDPSVACYFWEHSTQTKHKT